MYRHIPLNDHEPVRREHKLIRALIFWALVALMTVALCGIFPLGLILALPFMIGFVSTVRKPCYVERGTSDLPYDNV